MSTFESFSRSRHPEAGPAYDPTGIRTVSVRLRNDVKNLFLRVFGDESEPILWNIPVPEISRYRENMVALLNNTVTPQELESMRMEAYAEHTEKDCFIKSLPPPRKILGWTIPGMDSTRLKNKLGRERDILVMVSNILDHAWALEMNQASRIPKLENEE